MRPFTSNDKFFDSVRGLIAELHATDKSDAAEELQSGFSCLNGLADDYALVLESIDRVVARFFRQLATAATR
jgi:hypothetical protein